MEARLNLPAQVEIPDMRYVNCTRSDRKLRERLVGRTIRRARVKRGLTQFDVAESLRYTSAQFVSNWERGVSLPPEESLRDLAQILAVSPKSIVDTLAYYREREVIQYRKRLMELVRS